MAYAYTLRKMQSLSLVPALKIDSAMSLVVLLSIALWTSLSIYQQNPPAPVLANAPLTEFSSGRAMQQLKAFAKQPHPIGSLEHSTARDYILQELATAGLNPQVQETTGVNQVWLNPVRAGRVQNIIAKLYGTANTKAVLLVGHYDSVPTAIGASDDGAAVVTMLETLRALRAGTPLRNDVIFLFTDGEENASLGANAFVAEHPWAKDVGVVLNFEARGNSGPSIMFETSTQNGWLIREFAKAATHPVAHSFAYEIYRLLPNDTDLTTFKKAGFAGLNFAYINGFTHYHTLLDSVDQIDERSLQHHGSYALALARQLGNQNLENKRETNAVYFDIFGRFLVHYSSIWVLPLTIFLFVSSIGLLVFGLRSRRLTFSGMALGLGAFLSSMIVASLMATLIWSAILKLQNVSGIRPKGESYHSDLYLMGFVALTIAITAVLYNLFHRRITTEDLASGGLLGWLILLVPTSLFVPGGSYLLTWPLLFSLPALWMMWRKNEGGVNSLKLAVLLSICAIPGIILLTPVIYQTFVGLTLSSIGVVMAMVVLLLGLLIPHLRIMAAPKKWLLPVAAALLGAGLIVAAILASGSDANHPRLDSLFYSLNADTNRAVWASFDKKPDEWTSRFLSPDAKQEILPEVFATSVGRYLQSQAPVGVLAAPTMTLLDDSTKDGARVLRMRIASPRQAAVISIYVDSTAEVLAASVNGRHINTVPSTPASNMGDSWGLRYYDVPPEGIELAMEVKSAQPVKVRVVDQSYGFPNFPGQSFSDRPAYLIPAPISSNNSTFVSKSFVF